MPPLSTDLFDYSLPAHLIAQLPVARRDQSRLLVVNRQTGKLEHRLFSDLPGYIKAGDALFRNNAAVLPARLHAKRPTGGAVECLLLRPSAGRSDWWCLLRPGKKLRLGSQFEQPGVFRATVLEKDTEGVARVSFQTSGDESITSIANRLGDVPLPPYIDRQHGAAERSVDIDRYQTVYADRNRQVAVAAPTAGLHFTPELLARLSSADVATFDLTLHVGLGTFKPIATPSVEAHAIHQEIYELPTETQAALFPPLRGRRIAVGTTTVRSIEDFLTRHSSPLAPPRSHIGEASLFLFPPCQFRGVDALITNFHQPRSTLLCLVAAFLTPGSVDGIAWLREIYREAIAEEYRFFSYGDAMLIV